MTVQRLENVGVVVEDLDAALAFFTVLGLTTQGRTTVEGDWVDRVVGLTGVRCDIAVMATPDGRDALELMKFHSPPVRPGDRDAPPNTLGLRRLAFSVDDVDATLADLRPHGAELLGAVEQFEDDYRLCYVRGPEGLIVMLAQRLG